MTEKRQAVTIADVAERAGVSAMTVSRVMNGSKGVRAITQTKVRDAVEALDYNPNVSARALAGGRVLRVLLLYTNASMSFLSGLLLGALDETARRGHTLLIERFQADPKGGGLEEQLETLLVKADAFVIPPPIADDERVRDYFAARNLPVSFISNAPLELVSSPGGSIAQVSIDDEAAAYELTNDLIALGHRRIGLIKGPEDHYSSLTRFRGYRRAIEEHGLTVDPALIDVGAFTFESARPAAQRLLSMEHPPTAIFACNDEMAAAVVGEAARHGVSIPDRLSVVGFDDAPIASSLYPRLTTVRQPLEALAREAVAQVSHYGSGASGTDGADSAAHLKMLPYELIKGQSVAPHPRD